MNRGCLKQVILHLVVIRHEADLVGANVLLVAEGLELTEDADVLAIESLEGAILSRVVGVNPLFHFQSAGAVIYHICYVGGLLGDTPDAADERDMGDLDVVNFERSVGERLLRFEDLFDGDWSEGV